MAPHPNRALPSQLASGCNLGPRASGPAVAKKRAQRRPPRQASPPPHLRREAAALGPLVRVDAARPRQQHAPPAVPLGHALKHAAREAAAQHVVGVDDQHLAARGRGGGNGKGGGPCLWAAGRACAPGQGPRSAASRATQALASHTARAGFGPFLHRRARYPGRAPPFRTCRWYRDQSTVGKAGWGVAARCSLETRSGATCAQRWRRRPQAPRVVRPRAPLEAREDCLVLIMLLPSRPSPPVVGFSRVPLLLSLR